MRKKQAQRIIKLLRAIDEKLGEVVAGQERLEALLEPGKTAPEETANNTEGGRSALRRAA
jgi:hypothetical protein